MTFLALLEAKRDGQALSPEQIASLVQAFTHGQVPDYQMAAFLMAVFFRGMTAAETRALTHAMRDSGEVLRFEPDPRPLVDKHSTGGVGDKVSLVLTPLLAALGFRVPMISGRALGITGGTLDKLESIPGFRTSLSAPEIVRQVQAIGAVICSQTAGMVPADRLLYALRDVTGTVPSVPLITASILSKKLAESLQALVLDVKFGSGAFMPTVREARTLGHSMVTLAKACGVEARALLTDMNTPLGRAAGNWLEVREAVGCLEGRGPADLEALVLELAAHLLALTGQVASLELGRQRASASLRSRAPRRKWDDLLAAHGADLAACERKLASDHTAACVREVRAAQGGVVRRCDARTLGTVLRELGAGRFHKESVIQPDVGLDGLVKPGEVVEKGAVLCRVHAAVGAAIATILPRLATAFEIGDEPPASTPLIQEVITDASDATAPASLSPSPD